jgi:integrase
MRETAGLPTPPAQLDDDVLAFLRERHLSTLTTLRPDGSPHVVPVGFTWDEEALVARVITHRASRKVRHKSLTLDQAQAMLTAAVGTPMNAYIVLSLLTGVRTEELRALTWDHLDLEADPPTIMVWRSVRRGGETKRLNGKVERSHRIDSEEFYRLLEGQVIDDTNLFTDKLQEWEDYYNYHRPHGALNGQTPYERLRQKTQDPLS